MTGILAVFLDDARWDALDHMPWTKSMAERRGITCTDARSNAPICVTARLVFHSGRLDTKSGGGAVVQEDNWGVWLQAAGFRTAAIGKWHLHGIADGPPTTGWDHVVWPTDQQGHYDVVHRVDGVDVPVPGSAQAFQQEHIEAFAGDDDWFVFWGHNSPHWPYAGDPARPFMGSTIPVRPRPAQDGTNWPSWINARPPYTDWSLEHSNARSQAAELHEVDRRLKAIWNHLEAEGLADDTTVIVTSDNGRQSGSHRLAGAGSKNTPYEESTVVPIVAWGPTIPMQQAITCPTSIVDIPATVLAIAGATAPHPLDGDDLRDMARHPGDYADRAAVVQITNNGTSATVPWSDTICVTGWKLIRNRVGGTITPGPGEIFELYDLANDPGELVNLASDPAYSAIVQDLDARLDSMIGAPASAPEFTGGDQVYDDDGYRYHVFLDSGMLTMVSPGIVDYEVVSGGGGGGGAGSGQGGVGGGGGSGVPLVGSIEITESTAITVGAGGIGSANNAAPGGSGGDSSIGAAVVVPGGGGGGAANSAPSAGASGGGGGGPVSSPTYAAGAAGSLGGNGGNGLPASTATDRLGGGGGGAGGDGGDGVGGDPGVGGAGVTSTVLGDNICGGGGGGGGTGSPGGASHGGGAGGSSSTSVTAGTPNTGGGGGGGATAPNLNGGNGGSGRVVVRYPTP